MKTICFPIALLVVAGCLDTTATDTEVAAVETENGMSWNGMSWNGMSINGLTENGMSWNGMSWNGIDPKDIFQYLQGRSILETLLTEPLDSGSLLVEALAGTVEGSQLLAYSVKCAFAEGHDFQPAPWAEAAPGVLGLIDHWEQQGLNDEEIELWYGCMLSHVNAFGVSVPISIVGRQPSIDKADKGYSFEEGAFFGRLTDSGGEGFVEDMYACYSRDVVNSCGTPAAAWAYLQNRLCANFPGACSNMTIVGECANHCSSYDGLSYADCAGNSGFLARDTAITVRLKTPPVCDPN